MHSGCTISHRFSTAVSPIYTTTTADISRRQALRIVRGTRPLHCAANRGVPSSIKQNRPSNQGVTRMASKPSIPWSTDNKPISTDTSKESKKHPRPSPSASTIVVSQSNKVLLLHRYKTSSAFPSAHVFPGGNLDPSDGKLPEDDTDPARHLDSIAYRTGAIRELFEEAGVLLARESSTPDQPLLSLDPDTRLAGRNDVLTNSSSSSLSQAHNCSVQLFAGRGAGDSAHSFVLV